LNFHTIFFFFLLRICVLIPPVVLETRTISDLKNEIVEHVAEILGRFGHKIKVDDSYGSETSVKSIELPQTFRKIQKKSHGSNNAFLPTLDEYIAATYSNAHSACTVGTQITPPYVVALFWSLYYLHQSEEYRTLGVNALVALLLVPSVVGGFPIIYLHNMAVRAESDLLSPFLALCAFCQLSNPEIARFMINFIKVETSVSKNKIQLWKDPYSVRVGRPVLPTTVLNGIIGTMIEGITKHIEILELIKLMNSPQNARILKILDEARPCHIKVLSNLYAASPAGVFSDLIKKFETGRSVLELLILRVGRRRANYILRRILRIETKLQQWRVLRLKGFPQMNVRDFIVHLNGCPALNAGEFRKQS
jgi:hypothetical protein